MEALCLQMQSNVNTHPNRPPTQTRQLVMAMHPYVCKHDDPPMYHFTKLVHQINFIVYVNVPWWVVRQCTTVG